MVSYRTPEPGSPGGIAPLPSPSSPRRTGNCSTPEERQHALLLLASGMKAKEVAASVGRSYESIRLWRRRAEKEGTMPAAAPDDPASTTIPAPATQPPSPPASPPSLPQRAPKDPGSGLGAHEVDAILDLKKKHPSMGPAQIRAQLKRFRGWRVAARAIAKALRDHGYETVHTASRPKGQEEPRSWQAPHRNALWQLDFADLRVGAQRVSLLVVLDDFSRYVVAHELMLSPTSEGVVGLLREAIRRHGKPEAIYTDRGGPFLAWSKPSALGSFLDQELIDHHVSPAYRPMGRGKIEALIHTVQRELWHVVHFESVEHARGTLRSFFDEYNHRRAHMGIDGLTPADRFSGRWQEVFEHVQAASRKRQGAATAPPNAGSDPFSEEFLPAGAVEVLRLLIADGRMRMQFLGHCVDLGAVKP